MATRPAQSREVEYPEKCKSVQARKKHKEQVLAEHPDTLYADFIHLHGKKIKNNLIFHTTAQSAWKSAICKHFPFTIKGGIGRGGRITVCEDENLDMDNPVLTITYYTKGTVLIQGNELSLDSFEESFPLLKTEVDRVGEGTTVSNTECEEDNTSTPSTLHTSVPPPSPTEREIRENLALLELDFTEFKEFTQARLSETTTSSPLQQLKEEVQQLKRENQASMTKLSESMRELQQENHNLRAQMAKLKEDRTTKEKTLTKQIEDLKEQLQNFRDSVLTPSPSPSVTSTAMNGGTTEIPPPSQLPSTQTSRPNKDSATNTQTPPEAESPPAPEPTAAIPAELRPSVVLLMDSNRKFLDPQKLFPRHQVIAKRCSTTDQAHHLLNKESLGKPQHIIIHTGTNDLHTLRGNTAEAVQRVAARASKEFPESHIVISTLLPRSDTPPYIIYGINMEITRRCTSLPNVHLAHHPTITLHNMYDGIHLHKDSVRIFAKTLKDAALGRDTVLTSTTPPAGIHRPPPLYTPRYDPPSPRRHSRSWIPPDHRNSTYGSTSVKSAPAAHLPPTPHHTTNKAKETVPSARKNTPQKRPQSYAAAVAKPPPPPARASPPATAELGEIREMLYSLCSRLLTK